MNKEPKEITFINDWPEDGYAKPGAVLIRESNSPNTMIFACPGCGVLGSILIGHPKPKDTPSWDIVSGSIEGKDITLQPSINCRGCCGWHGYLTEGVFKSC